MFIKSKNSKTKILIKVWRKISSDWKIWIFINSHFKFYRSTWIIWKERWHCIWFIEGLNKLIRIYTHFNYLYMYQNIFSNLLIKEKIKSLGISLSNFQYITFIFANLRWLQITSTPILKENFLLSLVIVQYRVGFS